MAPGDAAAKTSETTRRTRRLDAPPPQVSASMELRQGVGCVGFSSFSMRRSQAAEMDPASSRPGAHSRNRSHISAQIWANSTGAGRPGQLRQLRPMGTSRAANRVAQLTGRNTSGAALRCPPSGTG